MIKAATTLLIGIPSESNQTGERQRAAGYYGTSINGGWHTISASLLNFTGRIIIEATLEASPAAGDWFKVQLGLPVTGFDGGSSNTMYNASGQHLDGGSAVELLNDLSENLHLQFPVDPANPTGVLGDTGTVGWVVRGNFVWIRARIDRAHVPTTVTDVGNVYNILMVI